MYCKRCGAALPSHGFICLSCGTMMDSEQIKQQKEYIKAEKQNKKFEANLISDKYNNNPTKRDYSKRRENKFLGALIIILVLILLIIFAILKIV